MYVRSLAAEDNARSAPPGIAELLTKLFSQEILGRCGGTYGFIAIPHMAENTSAVSPVRTLTETGTCSDSRRQ